MGRRAYRVRMVGNFVKRLVLGLAAATLLTMAGALADQTDPSLDALFARLQRVDSEVEAQAIEQKIWSVWIKSPDPVLDLEMIAGILAFNQGRLKEALRIFDSITERAPTFAEGWNKRATVLFYMSDFDRSLADVARTIELEPRHFGALSGMGMIYMEIGDDEAAADALERALEVNPHIPGMRKQLDEIRTRIRGKAI